MTTHNKLLGATLAIMLTAMLAACGGRHSGKNAPTRQQANKETLDKPQPSTSLWGNDPKNAEKIHPTEESVYGSSTRFKLYTRKNPDGSTTKAVCSTTSPYNHYYSLYSPNGNLRLIASAYSEMGDIVGVLVDYDGKGRVDRISRLENLGDGFNTLLEEKLDKAYDALKEWITRPNAIIKSYPIKRDADGNITSVGTTEIRSGYKAKVYIKEWGPFWTSDLDGGSIGIFTLQEYQGDTSGSHVDYLYEGNRLIAELAYWKHTFIKARTYNRHGVMVKQYDNRDINIEDQAFYDGDVDPLWYADNKQ